MANASTTHTDPGGAGASPARAVGSRIERPAPLRQAVFDALVEMIITRELEPGRVPRVHRLGQRRRPDACRTVTPRTHRHRGACQLGIPRIRGMSCADFGAADDWTRARSGCLAAHD
jgi:hypothetical protein